MCSGIDRNHLCRIGKAIKAERPGNRNDDAAIDQAFAKPAVFLSVRIKMHFRRVLIESCGDLMLSFFDRHAVHMIDFFANLIIVKSMR